MVFVVIDEDELARERPNAIRRFLSPLASRREVACDVVKTPVAGGRVIAAHDGQRAGKEYRDWRFTSKHRNILCQYFELWKPSERTREWFLDRAYLNLFLIDRASHQPQELLSVHADPNNEDIAPVRHFKKGPHLHVKHLEEPLPRAHFPMTIGYVDAVVQSAPELTRVLGEVALLLSVEVIGRFEDAARQI
jgi:hypothetical protein